VAANLYDVVLGGGSKTSQRASRPNNGYELLSTRTLDKHQQETKTTKHQQQEIFSLRARVMRIWLSFLNVCYLLLRGAKR